MSAIQNLVATTSILQRLCAMLMVNATKSKRRQDAPVALDEYFAKMAGTLLFPSLCLNEETRASYSGTSFH